MNKYFIKKSASLLVVTLVATAIFITLVSGAISLGLLQMRFNKLKTAGAQALHISEAGINYYKWVLYHDPTEYCNNETCKSGPDYGPYGPYDYSDQSDTINGKYELYIFPPEDGSGIVKIKSVGWVNEYPNIKRSIEVQLGKLSLASHLILTNDSLRITQNTETTGMIHSNSGIRFDGTANSSISSAVSEYSDPSHSGDNEFGVHTHKTTIDPLPPASVPTRDDVFLAGRFFPVPKINIGSLDSYVDGMYTLAQQDGLVLESSGAYGYFIELMPPGNQPKMKIYRVTSITDPCRTCLNCLKWKHGVCQSCGQWGESFPTYGAVGKGKVPGGPSNSQYDVPANGIIFVKDNVWVDTISHTNATRVTILAFKEPFATGNANIILNKDVNYKSADATSAFGFVAQHDIIFGLDSENNLEINAAMVARDGKIGRENYPDYCLGNKKLSLTIFGSMAMLGNNNGNSYGFSYYDDSGNFLSGYRNIELNYDGNLRLYPPPNFPTTGDYRFISWREN
ncbi:MAG TPA: hypothetical protein PLD95_03060 [bacterium]|jgi:hypothetical protein|nr:hypothetical protein [bacterium]HOG38427.1 hypothetical protein [bacterium]HQI03312.1 hypothetical protein [bacterium]